MPLINVWSPVRPNICRQADPGAGPVGQCRSLASNCNIAFTTDDLQCSKPHVRLWSTSQEHTSDRWWADVLADPPARDDAGFRVVGFQALYEDGAQGDEENAAKLYGNLVCRIGCRLSRTMVLVPATDRTRSPHVAILCTPRLTMLN
jgi:hypothetical protein